MKRHKSVTSTKAPIRNFQNTAASAAAQGEPDTLEQVLGLWSDTEAEKVVAGLVELIRQEPQGVVKNNYYDNATGQLKIERISGRKHMQSVLQEIVASYYHEVLQQARPAAGKIVKKLESIESAAHRMFAALGIESDESDVLEAIIPKELRYVLQGQAALMAEKLGGFANHPPQDFDMHGAVYTDWHHQAQLRDVIVGIRQLREWATHAKERQSNIQANRRHHAKRHQGNVPLDMLVQDLYGLWIDCYHSLPKFSRDGHTNAPTGPFFRFVRGVCQALSVETTDEALGSRIALYLRGKRKLRMGHSVLRMGKSKQKKSDLPI